MRELQKEKSYSVERTWESLRALELQLHYYPEYGCLFLEEEPELEQAETFIKKLNKEQLFHDPEVYAFFQVP